LENYMIEHEVNTMNNFIMGFQIDEPKLCDDLIDYFKNTHEECNRLFPVRIPKKIVDCTHCFLLSHQNKEIYINKFLDPAINAYIEKYTHSNVEKFEIMEMIKMQHYSPNQGYHAWHSERNYGGEQWKSVDSENSVPVELCRHLVFMTYLNDVDDGGETEFLYQNIKIKPKKGLTLIWPADWTHTHRGIISPTQDKYIITGWINAADMWINN
jgi:hypothetical protein